jgi:hypothetical protein
MGLYPMPQQRMYWNTRDDAPIHPPIQQAMGRARWEQIHRYFHIWEPEPGPGPEPEPGPGLEPEPEPEPEPELKPASSEKVNPHDKVEPIAQNLRQNFKRYWHADTHVAVDECIQGFTGRLLDIVSIPSKPTPIGFKIWCLA